MKTKSEIMREILIVDAKLNSAESKGKKTVLKAYQRKLYAQYRKIK